MILRASLLLGLGALISTGCESRGFVPDCPPMPITDQGPNSPEMVTWRSEAVAKGCATAAGSSSSADDAGAGAAGGSGGEAGQAGSGN
jgi:hypothetical protein